MPSGPPSIAAIAAGIERTPKHAAAEQALSNARAMRTEAEKRQRELGAQYAEHDSIGSGTAAIVRRANETQATIRTLSEEIATARKAVAPYRAIHRHNVAKALAGRTREAAETVLAALADLRAAAAVLDEVDDALVRAGGGERQYVHLPDLGRIEAAARRVLKAPK